MERGKGGEGGKGKEKWEDREIRVNRRGEGKGGKKRANKIKRHD